MFSSLDQATLANKVARNMLEATRNSILSPEESLQNIKLAKEAAQKAVSAMRKQGSEEYKTAAQASKPQQSNKKEEVAAAVASETPQDSEDVTLQLPTQKEVETRPIAPLPWYYIDLQKRIQGFREVYTSCGSIMKHYRTSMFMFTNILYTQGHCCAFMFTVYLAFCTQPKSP